MYRDCPSGTCTFTVEPELENTDLAADLIAKYNSEWSVEGRTGPYYAARVSGPPEQCSPAEGGEGEIVRVTLVDGDIEVPYEVYEHMENDLIVRIEEEAEDEGPDPDDAYERRRDEERDERNIEPFYPDTIIED